MHSEIEKLIDLALADGQITEKERNVILNKGNELGVNIDELEMILEGKIHQLKSSQIKPTKEKVGIIKTCPSCGASVKSFQTNCEDCGHEYSKKISLESDIIEIFKKGLEDLPKTIIGIKITCPHCKSNLKMQQDAELGACSKCKKNFHTNDIPKIQSFEKTLNFISSFNVPNDKESNLTFLMYILSKMRVTDSNFNEGLIKLAYKGKADELIQRCMLLFSTDKILSNQLINIKKELDLSFTQNYKNSKLKRLFWLSNILFMLMSMFYFFTIAFFSLAKHQMLGVYFIYLCVIIFWGAISLNFYKFKYNSLENF
jgi:protein-arginine kinase activator protein McsA